MGKTHLTISKSTYDANLWMLARCYPGSTINELTKKMESPQPHVSRSLKRLEADKLIRVDVKISKKGKEKLIHPCFKPFFESRKLTEKDYSILDKYFNHEAFRYAHLKTLERGASVRDLDPTVQQVRISLLMAGHFGKYWKGKSGWDINDYRKLEERAAKVLSKII